MIQGRSILALDLSGVLFDFDPDARLHALGRLSALEPREVQRRVWESGLSPGWDAGSRITAAEVRGDLRSALGLTGPDGALDDAWALAFRPRRPAIELLPATADPTLVAFSNNGPLEEELLTSRHPEALAGFGALWLTWRLGASKPDPRAYRALEQRLDVRGAGIAFLDDSPANVDAALGIGWRATRCRSIDDLARALSDHGRTLPAR